MFITVFTRVPSPVPIPRQINQIDSPDSILIRFDVKYNAFSSSAERNTEIWQKILFLFFLIFRILLNSVIKMCKLCNVRWNDKTDDCKAVPLHAIKALGGRGGIASTHSRPRH
jgi:hypothetical protein